jgi:hypothetical protein
MIKVTKIREISAIRLIPDSELFVRDRIRKRKILAPLIIFIYCLILKGAIIDGWHGWYYTFQRVLAEILLGIHIIEAEKIDIERTQK